MVSDRNEGINMNNYSADKLENALNKGLEKAFSGKTIDELKALDWLTWDTDSVLEQKTKQAA